MEVCSLLHHCVDLHRYTWPCALLLTWWKSTIYCIIELIRTDIPRRCVCGISFLVNLKKWRWRINSLIMINLLRLYEVTALYGTREIKHMLSEEWEEKIMGKCFSCHVWRTRIGSVEWWKNSKNRLVHWIYYLKFKNICKYKLEVSYISVANLASWKISTILKNVRILKALEMVPWTISGRREEWMNMGGMVWNQEENFLIYKYNFEIIY